MKHCTLPTLLAVETTILPTVQPCRPKAAKTLRLVNCVLGFQIKCFHLFGISVIFQFICFAFVLFCSKMYTFLAFFNFLTFFYGFGMICT